MLPLLPSRGLRKSLTGLQIRDLVEVVKDALRLGLVHAPDALSHLFVVKVQQSGCRQWLVGLAGPALGCRTVFVVLVAKHASNSVLVIGSVQQRCILCERVVELEVKVVGQAEVFAKSDEGTVASLEPSEEVGVVLRSDLFELSIGVRNERVDLRRGVDISPVRPGGSGSERAPVRAASHAC